MVQARVYDSRVDRDTITLQSCSLRLLKESFLMSADELYKLALASGNEIANEIYAAKRNTREVVIKIIKGKEKATKEIQAYEDHDNVRNIVCLYDSSIQGDRGVLVLERAKCNLWELVDCLYWGHKLKATTTEKTEFIECLRVREERKKLWIESETCDVDWKDKKPKPAVLNLLRDVVYALDDLHKKTFIHGYLAPSNIMVFDHLGRLSAKISMSRGCEKTWRPPKGNMDTSIDLFGLGLIIHLLLEGDYPFKKLEVCQQKIKKDKNELPKSRP